MGFNVYKQFPLIIYTLNTFTLILLVGLKSGIWTREGSFKINNHYDYLKMRVSLSV